MNPKYQFCSKIKITTDVFNSCLNHALLTESEEIMGLLLGNVTTLNNNQQNINIFSYFCLSRKCKEKDRVEFDEIQIMHACEYAEVISKQFKITTQVVGWFHSHPKITFPPSAVDLNTQYSQQYQGPFVGLIFSCFNNEKSTNINKINLIAFQSKLNNNNILEPCYIDIDVVNECGITSPESIVVGIESNPQNMANILKNLLKEETEQYEKEIETLDNDDYLNKLLLNSNRQGLLGKIYQNSCESYIETISSEVENQVNYLNYIIETNKLLKARIKNCQEINKLRQDECNKDSNSSN